MIDTLEGSRKSIQDQADADIDLALTEHELRLGKSDEHYSQLHEDAVQFNEALALPFRNQELEWTSTDGKQSGTTVLSVRMKKFEKTIEAEEKELNLQHEDWVTIQQHLLELASEMVGPAALDRWMAGDLDASTFMDGAAEKVELEIAAEKKKFVAQIEKLEKESMKKMKDSEKVSAVIHSQLYRILTTSFL